MKMYFNLIQGYTRKIEWENTNKLLNKGYKGVKTGITNEAGYCLSSYFSKDNFNLIIVMLGCKTSEARWIETLKLC